jgi:hypothetical protein
VRDRVIADTAVPGEACRILTDAAARDLPVDREQFLAASYQGRAVAGSASRSAFGVHEAGEALAGQCPEVVWTTTARRLVRLAVSAVARS